MNSINITKIIVGWCFLILSLTGISQTWEPRGPNDNNQASYGSALYTSVAVDGTGTLYVVYDDGANGQKATVKNFDGTNWVTVGSRYDGCSERRTYQGRNCPDI